MTFDLPTILIIALFVLVYAFIIVEHLTRINKAAIALLGAALVWLVFFVDPHSPTSTHLTDLITQLASTSQVIFFLLGAMTIVELIDSHHGFELIVAKITTRSKVKLLWIVGVATFFVSSVLDNLTSTIVMVSLLRKILPERSERWFYGAIVVIAANAGGAWTPIGDVTTTLLWIKGNITTLSVMANLIVPSLLALLVILIYGTWHLRGQSLSSKSRTIREPQPGARLIFWMGIGCLIFVPVLKELTGIPPFMAMFAGVGILWVATDLWHWGHHDRDHLKMPHALTRIDTAAILFFAGILLTIGALDAAKILTGLAKAIDLIVPSYQGVAVLLGLVSAVIDNVPLVAASTSMYSLETFPVDSPFWNLIAYCAGTGGSLLIIGSAAGVVLMSLEKVNFWWYLRRISLLALASFAVGAAAYIAIAFLTQT